MINIALFQPDIPQNTAATIRLCACLNSTLEIIEPCGFQFDEKRLKSIYMDYYKNCKIIRHQSFDDFIKTKENKRIILLTTKAKKIIIILILKKVIRYYLEEKVLAFQIQSIR
jgi:tRNA (cytidine/uridine-2'-O-)-methyltransferase